MNEYKEQLWQSSPMPGASGRWLVYSLQTFRNPRTDEPSHQIEVRFFGPLGTFDKRTGPFNFFITIPLALWPHLRKAAGDAERILTSRGLLPPKEEWHEKGGCITTKSDLLTSPRIGADFLRIMLEEQRERAGCSPRSRHKVLVVSYGCSGSGTSIETGCLPMSLTSFLAFPEHLETVEQLLQERGLIETED